MQVLIWLWKATVALLGWGSALTFFALQTSPETAESNLQKWLVTIGLDNLATLLPPYADRWATAFSIILVIASAVIYPWRKVLNPSRTIPAIGSPKAIVPAPRIEIIFESRDPYEVTEIAGSVVMSRVRIGIKNSGGSTLSNCVVQIDKIVPLPNLYGGLPMRLQLDGSTLRHNDKERWVEVAYLTKGYHQFCFAVPDTGGFGEARNFIDTNERKQ